MVTSNERFLSFGLSESPPGGVNVGEGKDALPFTIIIMEADDLTDFERRMQENRSKNEWKKAGNCKCV